MHNKTKLVIAVVSVLIVAAIVSIVVFSNSSSDDLQKKLELGQKYLTELEYEKAVAVFKEALSIDPANKDAKDGFEKASVEWINALCSEGRNEEALGVLTDALMIIPDSEALLQLKGTLDAGANEGSLDQINEKQGDFSNEGAIVDIDLDADSYSVNGMPLKSIDYTKMLESLGGSENPYIYYHTIGSADDVAIDALSSSNMVLNLSEDGSYHDSNGNVVEPERKYLRVYNGDGFICQYDYWCSDGRSSFKIDTYHENNPSSNASEEIATFSVLPFTYGTYEEMNSIFHTDEIMSSGESEDIGNGYVQYKCTTSQNGVISMNYHKGDAGQTTYGYSINGIHIDISFSEGFDYSDSVTYTWN